LRETSPFLQGTRILINSNNYEKVIALTVDRLLEPKYMNTIIGYIGEKCSIRYLRDLGFRVSITGKRDKKKGKFDNFPYYRGDLQITKILYPNVTKIEPEEAYDVETGEFRGGYSVSFSGPRFRTRYVEVKTSFGKFPKISKSLTLAQKKRKIKPLYIRVKIKEVNKNGVRYEIKENPLAWASENQFKSWKNQKLSDPTPDQMKNYIEKLSRQK
jgi:hypothetical protein